MKPNPQDIKSVRFGVSSSVDPKIWKQLDPHTNRLTRLRVEEAREKYRKKLDAATRQIRFHNRRNANSMRVPYALLEMQCKNADEFAGQQYSIFRDVWLRLGGFESGAFIRTISWMVIHRQFEIRGVSFAHEEERRFLGSGGLRPGLSPGTIIKRFESLKNEWRNKLEIKALEAEVQENAVAPARTSSQEQTSSAVAPRGRAGRPARLASDFIAFAGRLWLTNQNRDPRSRSSRRAQLMATDVDLGAMAARLDSKGYVPPAKYLESKAAHEVNRHNILNSNSKTGAIKTWSQLVSAGDKDHLRGMRRLLSRCAKKMSSQVSDGVRK